MIHRTTRVILPFITIFIISCTQKLFRPILPADSREFFLEYQAILENPQDTVLKVRVLFPKNISPCDSFRFPVQVPGTYELKKYGKYVSDFHAYDVNGDAIDYEIYDSSIYVFGEPKHVSKIEYTVHQTFGKTTDSISPYIGTRFKPSHCQINPFAAFGFFSRLQNKALRLKITAPAQWEIATPLIKDSADFYYADSYNELQDSPILIGRLSKSAFQVDSTRFFVYVHSDSPLIYARKLKKYLKSASKDVIRFIDKMPTKEYSFIFSFLEDSLPGAGALEHRKSSLYVFSSNDFDSFSSNLKWIARHELFHTVIPLSIRGDELANPDFSDTNAIEHLWFYEGLAQWAAFKMQLWNGTISPEQYLNILRMQLIASEIAKDSANLLSLSKSTLREGKTLTEFYRRGFIIGTALDIFILQKTSGNVSLRDVILQMKNRYTSDNLFPADSLFEIIASFSHPDVKAFLYRHLSENKPLELAVLFDDLGIQYSRREKHPFAKSDFGLMLYSNYKYQEMKVSGVYEEAQRFGFKTGDVLLAINGQKIYPNNFPYVIRDLVTSESGKTYEATIQRNGNKETFKAETVPLYLRHKFTIDNTATWKQRTLRTAWINK